MFLKVIIKGPPKIKFLLCLAIITPRVDNVEDRGAQAHKPR